MIGKGIRGWIKVKWCCFWHGCVLQKPPKKPPCGEKKCLKVCDKKTRKPKRKK